ncbi:hypothetical protein [Streptomyces sp. NPDC004376]
MTDLTTDFDGCNSECRRAGQHSLRWGGCEYAEKPEPTAEICKTYTDIDGYPSIGYDSYTVEQLAELIEPALRRVGIRLGPNALALLERGQTVSPSGGEYANLAREAAHAIIHRNDQPQPDEPTASHTYLSTACLHGEHGYCQSNTGRSGAKVPASCKWCQAACTCSCHRDQTA